MIFVVKLNNVGYDEYVGFVVSAKTKEEAITFIRNNHNFYEINDQLNRGYTIKKVNELKKPSLILESFNAG